jgi:hypothetical protein
MIKSQLDSPPEVYFDLNTEGGFLQKGCFSTVFLMFLFVMVV